MRYFIIRFLIAAAFSVQCVTCAADEPTKVSVKSELFQDRIVPLLYEKCFCCHGGAAVEGGYSLASLELLFQPGDSGLAPISLKGIGVSELLARITTQDLATRMPLNSVALDTNEIDSVKNWIALGAETGIENRSKSLIELYAKAKVVSKSPEHYSRPIPIAALLLSRDGKHLLVGGSNEVLVWNLAKENLSNRIPTRGRMISDLKWAPGGKLVVASGSPGTFGVLEVFDAKTMARLDAFGFTRDLCTGLAASPYRNEIAAGFADGSVSIYSLDNREPRVSTVAHSAGVTDVAWTNRGDRLYSASLDRSAKSFDTGKGQLLFAYADHERSVGGIVDTPFGPVTLDETGTLRIWSEGEESRSIAKLDGFTQVVQKIAVCGDILLVADQDRIRRISILQDEVDDDKAKEKSDANKPKKKKRTRFKELGSLESAPGQRFTSIAANSGGLVAAGFASGQVILWRMSESTKPWKIFTAMP